MRWHTYSSGQLHNGHENQHTIDNRDLGHLLLPIQDIKDKNEENKDENIEWM
jgi:hypothetical protein